jgi:bacteriorhodopsin
MMNDLEKEYIDDLPEETNYPALKTITVIAESIGIILAILSVMWFAYLIYWIVSAYINEPVSPHGLHTTDLLLLLPLFFMLFASFQFVLISEVIRLGIDLQGNADRQSILLTLILNRMVKKGTP